MKTIYEWARSKALPILVSVLIVALLALPFMKSRVYIHTSDKGAYISSDAEDFIITYRHSVNKGEVKEYYSIDYNEKTINLNRCEFESYGAGMPDQLPKGVIMTQNQGSIALQFPANPQKQIFILPGREADHKLLYNSKDGEHILHLGQIFPYKQVKIEFKRQSVLDYIIHQQGG